MPFIYIFKSVILSVLLTVVLVATTIWVARDHIVAYVVSSIDTSQTAVPSQQTTTVRQDEQVADMVAVANEAVVSVLATRDVPVFERFFEEVDPFGGLFGGGFQVPRVREQGTQERQVAGGSGFIVSASGLVVTNRHVVSDTAARYSVVLSDGLTFPVEILARDQVFDIAVLQIITDSDETDMFSYLEFGDSDSLRLGQTVISIGNALAEFQNSVSKGVISGLSRTIEARGQQGMVEQLDQVIQTDAAINLGNSGGPLLNTAGEVVGMNVAASLRAENIGFALPSNVVSQIVQSVAETGEIIRPFLGIRHMTVTPRVAEENDLGVSYGALLTRGQQPEDVAVMPGSPADRAGLQEGDIILQINDRRLDSVSLAQALRSQTVGATIPIVIYRDGEELTLQVTLVAFASEM